MIFPCPFILRSPLAENPACLSVHICPLRPPLYSGPPWSSRALSVPQSSLGWVCLVDVRGREEEKKVAGGSSCRSPGAGNCLMGLHTHGHEEIPKAPAGGLHSLGPPLPSRGPLQLLGYPPLSSLLLTLGLHPVVYPHPSGDPGLPSGPGPLGPPLHSGAPFCPPGLLLSPGAASPSRLSSPPPGVPLCSLVSSSRNPILWGLFHPYGSLLFPGVSSIFQGSPPSSEPHSTLQGEPSTLCGFTYSHVGHLCPPRPPLRAPSAHVGPVEMETRQLEESLSSVEEWRTSLVLPHQFDPGEPPEDLGLVLHTLKTEAQQKTPLTG